MYLMFASPAKEKPQTAGGYEQFILHVRVFTLLRNTRFTPVLYHTWENYMTIFRHVDLDVPDLRRSGWGMNVIQGSVFFDDEKAGSHPLAISMSTQKLHRSPSKATNDDNVSTCYTLPTPDLRGCG